MNTPDAIAMSTGRARGIGRRLLPLMGIGVAVLANAAWIVFLGYLVLSLFG